jgi:hypothetical protein
VYRPGADNRVADALSRHPSPFAICDVVTSLVPSWISAVLASYRNDSFVTSLLSKLALDPEVVPNYSVQSGLLRYRSCIWVGDDPTLQHHLMTQFHSSSWGGHSGAPVTYMWLKQCFAWCCMKTMVKQFVQACSIYQQSKYDRSKSPGLLQPLPVPESAWQVISMDFIEGLPLSSSFNCILVVIDLLTKYGHFIPLRHPFSAASVAKSSSMVSRNPSYRIVIASSQAAFGLNFSSVLMCPCVAAQLITRKAAIG